MSGIDTNIIHILLKLIIHELKYKPKGLTNTTDFLKAYKNKNVFLTISVSNQKELSFLLNEKSQNSYFTNRKYFGLSIGIMDWISYSYTIIQSAVKLFCTIRTLPGLGNRQEIF